MPLSNTTAEQVELKALIVNTKQSPQPCTPTPLLPFLQSKRGQSANGTVQPPTLFIGQGHVPRTHAVTTSCTSMQVDLTGPPHTGASPCPSPPQPPSAHYLSFTASCVSSPWANGGHRTTTSPHCNHTLPLEPTINPHTASELNTAKPDPHTASKGAPAATKA